MTAPGPSFTDTAQGGSVTAVLGPTNTGKTFLAMDRMLGYASGMIGFPLRLLARENFDKAVAKLGPKRVALITGEEKILPAGATHFICTVESMPVDRVVDFLAVDEIQLCADPFRGHVFTDRLLHARGRSETMFLGSESMRGLIAQLIPRADFVTRPRFSKLRYAGVEKLTRLPKRAAVVAFSLSEVYGIAELIRRQRGGAAVVMGALSPRTRNAQVSLYQNGEVDYLVATDAIGMGLNMDVDHVSFASLSKFDGKRPRDLTAPEVAQIAGRAGRHMNDGTFGTAIDAPMLASEIIDRVETHTFEPIRHIYWRNPELRFTSVEALRASLTVRPTLPGLSRPRAPDDQQVLDELLNDEDIRVRAKGIGRVKLLWDVCQVPDFRKLLPASHARLLGQVYRHLTDSHGTLPDDWVEKQVTALDKTGGDMHALMDRLAAIRVWTFIANRGRWLADSAHWQLTTRAVEDRLSDALHERLTQQFIDKRTALLVKKLNDDAHLAAQVADDGTVTVEGHHLGRLDGLVFTPERTGERRSDRAVINAATKALRREIRQRVKSLTESTDDKFSLDATDASVRWNDAVIGTLTPGNDAFTPQISVIEDEQVDAAARAAITERARTWLTTHIAATLGTLITARSGDQLPASVRGLMFALGEGFGNVRREDVEQQVTTLTDDDRKILARLGVRTGVFSLYMPDLLKDKPVQLLSLLWRVAHNKVGALAAPPSGRVSFPTEEGVPASYYAASGYRPISGTAYRVDMLERFAAEARGVLRVDREQRKADSAAPATNTNPEQAPAPPETPTEAPETKAPEAQPTPHAEAAPQVTPETPVEEPTDTPTETTITDNVPEEADMQASAEAPSAEPAKTPPPPRLNGLLLLPPEKLSLLGIDVAAGEAVLRALGYRTKLEPDVGLYFLPKPKGRKDGGRQDRARNDNARKHAGAPNTGDKGPRRDGKKKQHGAGKGKKPSRPSAPSPKEREPDPDSPFAVLKGLIK